MLLLSPQASAGLSDAIGANAERHPDGLGLIAYDTILKASIAQKVERIETTAERLVERTRESWRETEGLSQTRAGRLRLVARGALAAIGETALIKAEEGVKIKGEKIYLA